MNCSRCSCLVFTDTLIDVCSYLFFLPLSLSLFASIWKKEAITAGVLDLKFIALHSMNAQKKVKINNEVFSLHKCFDIVISKFQERRYICFDGDLDPVYIENMKTIMDESKILTLGNGECIRMENHCAILFEVTHFNQIDIQNTFKEIRTKLKLNL